MSKGNSGLGGGGKPSDSCLISDICSGNDSFFGSGIGLGIFSCTESEAGLEISSLISKRILHDGQVVKICSA